jgi:hypothetical protein
MPETTPKTAAESPRYIRVHWLVAIVLAIAWVLVPFVASEWTANAIRAHYDRQLEDYRKQLEVRDRAAILADYIAMWFVSGQVKEAKTLEEVEFYQRMNKLSFELALFLPADLYRDLGPSLIKAPDSRDVGDLLIEVRKRLLAEPGDLTGNNVIYHFPGIRQALEEQQSKADR